MTKEKAKGKKDMKQFRGLLSSHSRYFHSDVSLSAFSFAGPGTPPPPTFAVERKPRNTRPHLSSTKRSLISPLPDSLRTSAQSIFCLCFHRGQLLRDVLGFEFNTAPPTLGRWAVVHCRYGPQDVSRRDYSEPESVTSASDLSISRQMTASFSHRPN